MKNQEQADAFGDNHIGTSTETPLRSDAFARTDDQKIEAISFHYQKIMEELGLDLTDDSLSGTPYRVAKMYVKELFSGLDPKNKPKISIFDNKYEYNKMLIESDITFNSSCEHHFLPIIGKAHIGYISSGKVIGLSKMNRIVQYFGRRPQVQERMTMQIFNELKTALQTEDVIVVVEAEHLCVSTRGVNDKSSKTTTLEYSGQFSDTQIRNDFFKMI
ncbi:GTP cyclohydrolase I FolE [Flavobacterium sp. ANB]|uniref:GTP cyclohydrolase I FolE n=1 Tax=unclassified Flavobacterium TaxID=196869 RepID=UPI0012B7CDC4|nr:MULTISPECIES: GTP cyclohydrolase I FolE [unclassified Flavobacterium]MBF4519059.1 GTP cyclohydrolase I FolE [Flavobacterium sp. ANB]MTD71741.1 GTP cyclohydrolase I FolE [Flavobacterium sp. LC2016-13]